MGTDIRMYAEHRNNGRWQFIGEMLENECDTDGNYPYYPSGLYNVRNYSLFAILAGIRNELEEPFEPIAPRRGIPPDLSPELSSWFASFHGYETYASWLTLEELVSFDWHGKRRKEYATVDTRVAHLFHPERRFPFREWPRDIVISYSPGSKKYANAIWTETYAEAVGPDVMALLDKLSQKYGASNEVRLVFWFH